MLGTRRSAWVVVSFLPNLAGCARTYDVAEPRLVRHEAVNIVASRVWLGVPFMGTEVRLRSSARAGTLLRGAKLAPLTASDCASGTKFARIEKDGMQETEGPLSIEGNHDLALTFVDRINDPWREPLVVDVELDTPPGTSCVRVPLHDAPDAPTWKMADDSAGLAVSMGVRGFPFSTTHAVGIEPLWETDVRLGAAFGRTRIWGEFAGGGGRSTGYADLILSGGADRAISNGGRFALMVGAAYDVVFTLYRAEGEQAASRRYLAHGPRFSPSLSFTLLENTFRGHLPAGRRTLYLELEVPTSVWFGTGNAPSTTIVPGLGFSIFWAI